MAKHHDGKKRADERDDEGVGNHRNDSVKNQ
jgi:hypothetical protein